MSRFGEREAGVAGKTGLSAVVLLWTALVLVLVGAVGVAAAVDSAVVVAVGVVVGGIVVGVVWVGVNVGAVVVCSCC